MGKMFAFCLVFGSIVPVLFTSAENKFVWSTICSVERFSLTNSIRQHSKTNSIILRNIRKVVFNPLRPNNDLSQTSHYNIKGLSVSEVMRIENMITQVHCY